MNSIQYHISVFKKNPMLSWLGVLMFFLFIFSAISSQIDPRNVGGINVWINPMKFSLSVCSYAWTMSYILFYFNEIKKVKMLNWLIFIAMIIEILLILIQTYRGEKSHYNLSTPFNANIFYAMIGAITINTMAVILLSIWYFKYSFELSPMMLWCIRFGLLMFVLFSLEGYLMGAMLKHSVGTKDGPGGLMFLNWNINAGDLRVSHFIGLHGLQAIPLFGVFIQMIDKNWNSNKNVILVWVFSFVYLSISLLALVRALMGKPLLF